VKVIVENDGYDVLEKHMFPKKDAWEFIFDHSVQPLKFLPDRRCVWYPEKHKYRINIVRPLTLREHIIQEIKKTGQTVSVPNLLYLGHAFGKNKIKIKN